MKLLKAILPLILLAGCSGQKEFPLSESFDGGWLFCRGDIAAASKPGFDDSRWTGVELPHDWAIEDLPGTDSPFDPNVVHGVSSGYTEGGVGWYRKHFRDTGGWSACYLYFDGVYMDSDFWINGEHVGSHFYGYSPFCLDVSGYLNRGGDNTLAVRVDATGVTSRWYSGAGIYRHVKVIRRRGPHVKPFSTRITVSGSARATHIALSTEIVGGGNGEAVEALVVDPQGATVAAGRVVDGAAGFDLQDASLWSPDSPQLYTMRILVDGKVSDEQTFGVRFLEFSSGRGFLLNGEPLLLKGGCIHHDNGALGAMAFDRAEERKVRLLKEAGFNAVRTAHNPASKAFMDACDRLGLLVMDEFFDVWELPHFDGDYSEKFDSLWREDVASIIARDFNHPSVILWSSGNEILSNDTPRMARLSAEITEYIHSLDSSRPVTNGVNNAALKDDFLGTLDIGGYNYSRGAYVKGNRKRPWQPIVATESYASEAYAYWKDVERYPWVLGDFVWTAIDYIGESSIGWYGYDLRDDFYPWHLAWCGDIDICGRRQPQSFFRETLWTDSPMVYVAVRPAEPSFPLNPQKQKWSVWDWPDEVRSWTGVAAEGETVTVVAYSNCDRVELLLNGRSLGVRRCVRNRAEWKVRYAAGKLEARGLDDGGTACTDLLESAGEVSAIRIVAESPCMSADGQDICYLDISLVDAAGNVNPTVGEPVSISIEGPATLLAFTNSDPMDVSGFRHGTRNAWRGRCQAVIRSTREAGEVTVRVESAGGKEDSIVIKSEK